MEYETRGATFVSKIATVILSLLLAVLGAIGGAIVYVSYTSPESGSCFEGACGYQQLLEMILIAVAAIPMLFATLTFLLWPRGPKFTQLPRRP